MFVVSLILLIGIVFAAGAVDRNLNVGRDRLNKAQDLGIDTYNTTDYQKGDLWQRCLISNSDFNLPCSSWLSEEKLDGWEEENIKRILDVEIERSSRDEKTEVRRSATDLR